MGVLRVKQRLSGGGLVGGANIDWMLWRQHKSGEGEAPQQHIWFRLLSKHVESAEVRVWAAQDVCGEPSGESGDGETRRVYIVM